MCKTVNTKSQSPTPQIRINQSRSEKITATIVESTPACLVDTNDFDTADALGERYCALCAPTGTPIPVDSDADLQAVHNQAVHNQAVHNQAVHNQAVHNQAVHNQAVHNQAVHNQAVHNQAVHNQAVHNQAVHNPFTTRPTAASVANAPYARNAPRPKKTTRARVTIRPATCAATTGSAPSGRTTNATTIAAPPEA